jgi:hypothetical protein
VKPSGEIQAKAAELTKGANDDLAKIRVLYNFVSTRYRYIGIALGIGRYQPHSAADVLENQYGDCKDKHTLLASMLYAVGIRLIPRSSVPLAILTLRCRHPVNLTMSSPWFRRVSVSYG